VAKHAPAANAAVKLTAREGWLGFEIVDDGQGFDASVAASGTGLQNMRDRLEALGGRLEVRTGPGGTTVTGSVPIESDPRP